MGTRSLTVFCNRDGKKLTEIAVMYRQMDGYPEGHGEDLKKFLKNMNIVTGLSLKNPKNVANGMGCLTAQVIAHFKKEPGKFYIYPAKTRDYGEEYIYILYPGESGQVNMKVTSGAMTFFGFPGTKEKNMPVIYDGPISKFNAEQAMAVKANEQEPPNDFLDSLNKSSKKGTKKK